MDDYQRNPSFGSDSDGGEVESESQADSRRYSKAQSNSPTTVPKISEQLQEIYKKLGFNCGGRNPKGNRMAHVFFPSDSILCFAKGKHLKYKDYILCVSRDTICYFTFLNKNSEGSYVVIEIFNLKTQNKVGSFQGDSDGTGIVPIKNNIAKQVRWKWPKKCKSNDLYGIKVSLMNEEDQVIECCDVQPLYIVPHTNASLRNQTQGSAIPDSILQKAKQILSKVVNNQEQHSPNNIPLSDEILLAICLLASGRSHHPNFAEFLRRCEFASDHDAVANLTNTITYIQLLSEVPFSNSSDEEPDPGDLQQIEFLLRRLGRD